MDDTPVVHPGGLVLGDDGSDSVLVHLAPGEEVFRAEDVRSLMRPRRDGSPEEI